VRGCAAAGFLLADRQPLLPVVPTLIPKQVGAIPASD
jgi:hypothetical protein